ncbi:hypothetical protein ACSS6W_003722 [Trichoderma asperelloides]
MEPTSKGPKACTTCAKAKARCIPGPDKDSKCERCQRLKRECVSQRPAPPRAKKPPKRSRVAELEKRLDELSSQFVDGAAAAAAINPISSQQSGDSPSISVSSANHLSATERPGPCQQQQQQHQQQQQQQPRRRTKCDSIVTFEYLFPSPRSESAEVSGWTSEVGSNDCVAAAAELWPTEAEAETLLLQYHETHAPLAPFVIVPKHLMAADLHRQRPFLWRVVMMISCFVDGPRQHRMGKEVLAELGRMSVLDSTRNLETLQGLLLTISWLNFSLKSAQLTNLLFLARSMSLSSGGFGISYGAGGGNTRDEVKWGELEHARAYLGTYYLNAIVFNTNKKVDAFMNTSQLDNYCNLLTSPGEYHSDQYLARLVKIQMLSQSISMAMMFDPAQQQQPMQLPLTMVIQTFQEQIDAYRASLPPHLVDNSTIRCHVAISEILLADMAISDAHCSSRSLPHSDRIHLLWSCLHALRRFYGVASLKCCDITDREQRNFLGINASDLAYAIITGIKLLLVRIPDWDPRYIVSELGIREMLDKEIEDVGQVVARRKSDRWPEEDPMDRMHKLLMYGRDLVNMQLQQVAAEMEAGSAPISSSTPATVNKGENAQGWVMAGMEDLDDDLWQNFMNDTVWNLNGESMVMDSF